MSYKINSWLLNIFWLKVHECCVLIEVLTAIKGLFSITNNLKLFYVSIYNRDVLYQNMIISNMYFHCFFCLANLCITWVLSVQLP